VRLATWNVNSLRARLSRVLSWIDDVQPDVLCLQETKLKDDAFPVQAFADVGYEAAHFGKNQWNGVAIVSRVGLDNVQAGFAGEDPLSVDEARIVSATCAGMRVMSVYVPNGREVESEHYDRKLAWLAALRNHLESTCEPGAPVALCGDFNVAPDDRDVWDPAALEGMTHVSVPERRALKDLQKWGLVDAFRLFYDAGGLFSWWDYRGGSFHKGIGMRIDLVLVSEPVAKRALGALIDRNARYGGKDDPPSDHAPVVVEIADE
jgi:exodeoxyribonuclease-3